MLLAEVTGGRNGAPAADLIPVMAKRKKFADRHPDTSFNFGANASSGGNKKKRHSGFARKTAKAAAKKAARSSRFGS